MHSTADGAHRLVPGLDQLGEARSLDNLIGEGGQTNDIRGELPNFLHGLVIAQAVIFAVQDGGVNARTSHGK